MDDLAFIRDVAARLGCDAVRAEAVTFAVFQELRDRLTGKEADDVAAQLPSTLKTLWEEGDTADRPVARTHVPDFLRAVQKRVALPDGEAERAVRVVFGTLQRLLGSRHGTEGEAWDVFSQLPKDLKRLWLEAAPGRAARD
jgi:uncharacterized protein (DUF2267 family)